MAINLIDKNFKFWIENAPKEIVEEISKYSFEEKELFFSKDIEFGTAGMRGKIHYGTNGINEYTIIRAAYCYGLLLLKKYGEKAKTNGIVIAHDNRRKRYEFSTIAAEVISALGIKVFLFPNNELKPTPLLSYTIAQNDFIGGINITASHNPPTDNGFKIYNDQGIQCNEEETKYIASLFESVNYFKLERSTSNIFELTEEYENNYKKEILEHIPFDFNVDRKELKITFTSEHGTATKLASYFLEKMNVEFFLTKNQCYEDENFTNAKNPNPQSLQAYDEAIKEANKNGSTLIFATDPDADRFGIMVKKNNEWIHISGNELPLIQLFYKLTRLKSINEINKGDFIVRSIVTSSLADKIAKDFGIDVYKTHTGFKWIISKALELEKDGKHCLFAWEESYGSTIRTFTRDKDSFQALVQVIEMTHYFLQQGKTLLDVLNSIFDKYGHYLMVQETKRFEGANGNEKMNGIIENFRIHPPTMISGYKIVKILDFKKGVDGFPPQNYIIFEFENTSWFCLRPSGTEPILRIYFDLINIEKQKILDFLHI